MSKRVLFLFTILLFSFSIQAQFPFGANQGPSIKGKITGEVLDSISMQPVGFATLALRKPGKTRVVDGVLSDENGKFKFADIKNGVYDLHISFLGYEEKLIDSVELTLKDPDVDIKKVFLLPKSYVLDAVEVTDQRSLVENKADKIVYNAEQDATIAGGDATDVLRKVPMLSVDLEGNVSLRGSQNVKILINGKPSGMFSTNVADALKMFPADQIKKVEVITSPGAKYDGEGSGGIINIITKKENIEGFAGSVNASAGTRQNSLFLNLNAGKGRFGFSSGNAFFYSVPNDAENTFFRENDIGNGQKFVITQEGITNTSRLGFNTSASAFYDFNAFNSVNTSFTYRGFTFDLDGNNTGLVMDPNDVFDDSFSRSYLAETLFSGFDWNTDYTRKFENNKDQEFSLGFQYSGNIQDQDYNIEEEHIDLTELDRLENIINDGNNRELTFQADYVQPINGGIKLEFGAKSVLRKIDSDYTYEPFDESTGSYFIDDTRSNIFDYGQDVYAGYGSMNFVIAKKYTFITGLRYEHTTINGEFQGGEASFENDYDNFLPNFTISRSLKNFRTLKIAYSKRIQRPSLYYINPFTNSTDRVNIVVGNPSLAPEITHQLELSYNTNFLGFSIFSSAYYKKTNDVIEQILGIDGVASVNTFDNVGTRDAIGANVFTTKTINRLTVRGNFNVFRSDVSGVVNGEELTNESIQYNIFFGGDYTISGDFKADFFGVFNSPRKTLQGDNPSFSIYGIGLRKDFKNSSLGIRILDPFSENKNFDSDLAGPGFVQRTTFSLPFRSFGINYRYKFGKVDFKERKSKIKNTDLKEGEGQQGGGGGQGGIGG